MTARQPRHYAPDDSTESPLSVATDARDRDVLRLVERAIDTRAVLLAYQPVVPARRQDQPAMYEGLVRLLDPTGRMIPARDFIASVETHELGRRLDCLSLDLGLRTLSRHSNLRIAINMSARSIGYPDWVGRLESALDADSTLGERLVLEITESSAILMPDLVRVFMRSLQDRGVSFALDDFGSGFTSLRHLKDLYFDVLKIDGTYVRDIAANPDNQVVVKALLSIGRHFEMLTVAEAVETAEDARYLARIGVDCMQGYHFGAPTVRPDWDARDRRHAAG
ncbi:EAL domain-containing protein [Tranquillimonas rosea]|uniref:EAL domain-containing protein n=1 Tax=Tranquillimonas rosea TaxID=641238 RepID=UPI003BABF07D